MLNGKQVKTLQKMEQKLETVLSELAEKLGTSVDKLYGLTIKQAKIEIIGKIVHGIIFTLCGIAMVYITIFISEQKLSTGGPYSEISGWGFVAIFIGAADVVLLIAFATEFANFCKNLTTLITNPEYWAIQDILASIPSGD